MKRLSDHSRCRIRYRLDTCSGKDDSDEICQQAIKIDALENCLSAIQKVAAPGFTGISLLQASKVGYALRHLLLGTGRLIFNECVFDAVLFCLFHDRRNTYVT